MSTLRESREALKGMSNLLKAIPRQRNQKPGAGAGAESQMVVLKAAQADLMAAVLDRAVETMGEYIP